MKKIFVVGIAALLVACGGKEEKTNKSTPSTVEQDTIVEVEKNMKFGFDFNEFDVFHDTVKMNWTMSHMLLPYGIDQYSINLIAEMAGDSAVGLDYVNYNDPFIVLVNKGDTNNRAQHLIYEANIESYYVFNFGDSLSVEKHYRDIKVNRNTLTGEIVQNSNLTLAIDEQINDFGTTAALAEAFENIFAWSIDFFKLQAGDQFKVVYEQKSIEGKAYGIGDIIGIWFKHSGEGMYSFKYTTDSTTMETGYYNEEGKEMKRPFLMSPVKFARMTSAYNLRRFHPIYKRVKAHKGTDYAAPYGTPILSTADGTVTKASRSGGNGNYVKIRHNSTYETQYLHMQKFAKGIRPGVRVKQGDVIGYVGSTGAATGPHVCYRFWKNGRQVDHRAQKFPQSEPMKKELIPGYLKFITPLKSELDSLEIVPSQVGME